MNKSKLGVLSIIALLVLSLSVGLVAAQYTLQKTTDLVVGSDGTCSACETDVGITYVVQGTPGATGSVTASIYNGNPQPSANIPGGVSLNHFVVVSFDMAASDFSQATITLNYADSDVQNIKSPYTVYKYQPSTDSYVPLLSTVDTAAKTITVTLGSVDDPLLAIGGSTETAPTSSIPVWTWAVTISVVIIVVLASVLLLKRRNPFFHVEK
jgi:hypothetical protein